MREAGAVAFVPKSGDAEQLIAAILDSIAAENGARPRDRVVLARPDARPPRVGYGLRPSMVSRTSRWSSGRARVKATRLYPTDSMSAMSLLKMTP